MTIRLPIQRCLRVLRNAWALLGITLLILAASEFILRRVGDDRDPYVALTALRIHAEKDAPWAAEYSSEDIQGRRRLWRYRDFVMFALNEFHGRYINIGADSSRRTWNPASAASRTATRESSLYVYGGSTAWGWGNRDDDTIPSDLSRILNEAGLDIEVKNRATPAFFSTQEVIRLMLDLQSGARPDAVIFLDGLNETLTPIYNDGFAGDAAGRDARLNLSPFSRPWDAAVYFLQKSAVYRFARSFKTRGRRRNPEDAKTFDPLADDIARIYLTNMEIVSALAKRFHFQPLFYWQPTITTKKKLSSLEEGLRPIEPLILGEDKPLFAKVSSRVRSALSSDSRFQDIENMFDDSSATIYVDNEHYTEAASRQIAVRMSYDVLRMLRRDGTGRAARRQPARLQGPPDRQRSD
jgi:lysophospholipase L1-like esterase